jgi:hypothetical protein
MAATSKTEAVGEAMANARWRIDQIEKAYPRE